MRSLRPHNSKTGSLEVSHSASVIRSPQRVLLHLASVSPRVSLLLCPPGPEPWRSRRGAPGRSPQRVLPAARTMRQLKLNQRVRAELAVREIAFNQPEDLGNTRVEILLFRLAIRSNDASVMRSPRTLPCSSANSALPLPLFSFAICSALRAILVIVSLLSDSLTPAPQSASLRAWQAPCTAPGGG